MLEGLSPPAMVKENDRWIAINSLIEMEIRSYHALLTTRPPLLESDLSAVHFRILNMLAWSSVQMTLCWSVAAAMSAASMSRGLASKP